MKLGHKRIVTLCTILDLFLIVVLNRTAHLYEQKPVFENLAHVVDDHLYRSSPEEIPSHVVLIDISGRKGIARLESGFEDKGEAELSWSRPGLVSVLETITDSRNYANGDTPKVVGIDIDHSCQEVQGKNEGTERSLVYAVPGVQDDRNKRDPYKSHNDLLFFNEIFGKGGPAERVPVFVGVARMWKRDPAYWFDPDGRSPQLGVHGALITVLRDWQKLVPLSVEVEPGVNRETLSSTMAKFGDERNGSVPGWFESRLASEGETSPRYDAVVTDYRWLNGLKGGSVKAEDVTSPGFDFQKLAGRIVLIGAIEDPEAVDQFRVPGLDQKQPGILLHACAIESLIASGLVIPTTNATLALELGVFGTLALISLGFTLIPAWNGRLSKPVVKALPFLLSGAGTVFVLWLTYVALVATRVLWSDVIAVICVHWIGVVFLFGLERWWAKHDDGQTTKKRSSEQVTEQSAQEMPLDSPSSES